MTEALVDVALREGELLRYGCTLFYVALQFVLIAWWSRGSVKRSAAPRPSSDPTWFLPVHVWGIESVCHGAWWLFAAPFRGIVKTPIAFAPRFTLTTVVLGLTLASCFGAEALAHRRGVAARAPQATLPLGVIAGIISVQWVWRLLFLAFFPIP